MAANQSRESTPAHQIRRIFRQQNHSGQAEIREKAYPEQKKSNSASSATPPSSRSARANFLGPAAVCGRCRVPRVCRAGWNGSDGESLSPPPPSQAEPRLSASLGISGHLQLGLHSPALACNRHLGRQQRFRKGLRRAPQNPSEPVNKMTRNFFAVRRLPLPLPRRARLPVVADSQTGRRSTPGVATSKKVQRDQIRGSGMIAAPVGSREKHRSPRCQPIAH